MREQTTAYVPKTTRAGGEKSQGGPDICVNHPRVCNEVRIEGDEGDGEESGGHSVTRPRREEQKKEQGAEHEQERGPRGGGDRVR